MMLSIPSIYQFIVRLCVAGLDDIFGGGSTTVVQPAAPNYAPLQAANDNQVAAMKDLAQQDIDFRRQVYNEQKPNTQAVVDTAQRVANQQMAIADANQQRSNQQWNEYTNTYQPAERLQFANALGAQYMSPEERAQLQATLDNTSLNAGDKATRLQALSTSAEDRAATDAGNTAQASVNNAFSQQSRMLGRFGANPARMAAIAAQLAGQQGLAGVNAQNNARLAVRGNTAAQTAGVAAFGRNMPNTANQNAGTAVGAGSAAVANSNTGAMAGLPYAQFNAGGTASGMQAAQAGINNNLGWGGVLNSGYATGMAGANAANQLAFQGSDMSGIGALAGMAMKAWLADGGKVRPLRSRAIRMDDGGRVHGPGTGISDSVRAVNDDTGDTIHLSNGEYVLPADTVRAIGTEELDRIIRATHIPAARQRAMGRR